MKKQCGLCGQWLEASAFNGRAKDCSECRHCEKLRPPRGRAPIEQAMTPKKAKRRALEEVERISSETGICHELDHVIPIRSKVIRGSDDWVLICGLDVPENWQILPKEANRKKWMRFSRADANAEERRLARILGMAGRKG